jgi:hypothetical protein
MTLGQLVVVSISIALATAPQAHAFITPTRLGADKSITSNLGYPSLKSRSSSPSTCLHDSPLHHDAVVPPIGTVTILIPSNDADVRKAKYGDKSPVGNPTILEAATQLACKISWFSEGSVTATIVRAADDGLMRPFTDLEEVDALIALGLSSVEDMDFARRLFERRRERDGARKHRQCQFGLDCSGPLPIYVGPYDDTSVPLQAAVPWTKQASGGRMLTQMQGLFDRWTSDDFSVALMIFFNQFSGSEIDWVKHSIDATWEKGPVENAREFYNMITKCGDCITKCLADENCKTCLAALNAVDTRDQVASYRTIVSFESDLLKDFSYCILQKNNVFNCNAQIPTMPKVEPVKLWRGRELTVEAARSILVGHLDDEAAPEGSLGLPISWKVACGANVAYDQFPSQNQIFYESVNGNDLWYDPVFRVETIDGRNVWCKRHYKVRNGPRAGTFRFSVLDNGVTSNELWTIVGVADDLSWIVFHYAGAATTVGQRYIGGLLCTPDGALPPAEQLPTVWDTLRRAKIQPWELYVVDNSSNSPGAIEAGPPPLTFFRDQVMAAKANKKLEASLR